MIEQSTTKTSPPIGIPPIKSFVNPKANCCPQAISIQQKYINKYLRVTAKNGRVFYGKFQILDNYTNILLSDAIGQCAPQVSCPVNDTLHNWLDDKMKTHNYLNLEGKSQNQKKQLTDQFFKNKYYIGAIMIRGSDIGKVQIQQIQEQ